MTSTVDLPYFDFLLQELNNGNNTVATTFGQHVHWGYWENPNTADGSLTNFAQAAENLTQLVCDAGKIQSGLTVLDCGCGFGGTIASLNQRFTNMNLTGLNIDERQLERARQAVLPAPNNQIEFIQGNACALPFPDQSFDVVTAVECIFHFPSRTDFFAEAARVLRPGGRLALSDFVPTHKTATGNGLSALVDHFIKQIYGQVHTVTLADYAQLAENSGFKPLVTRNINTETLPTFEVLATVVSQAKGQPRFVARLLNTPIEAAQRLGKVLYQVLAYEKI